MSKFVKSFHNKGEKAAADLAAKAADSIDLAAKTIPENREKDVVSNRFTNMVTLFGFDTLCDRYWRFF